MRLCLCQNRSGKVLLSRDDATSYQLEHARCKGATAVEAQEGMTPFSGLLLDSMNSGGLRTAHFYVLLSVLSDRDPITTGTSPASTMMSAGTDASSIFARDASS